ncbi:MAG TPA: FAD-binding oxidoreductase [Candidatus Polarisedimenticolia bacterium]|nr:FAD-binding oxidoreductase [Candidatus Polarisedimenticolia bacterium]
MIQEDAARNASGLGRAFRGQVITPDALDYDRARKVFNASVDRHPALIVRPTDADDVALVVTHAQERGLPLIVRAGGHSLGGLSTGDGALILDLSAMRAVELDASGQTAWADAGILAGEYTAASHAQGFVTPFGDTASVGVAGLTLGGGVGWLVRKHGMTIDSLLAVEIVTADGRRRIASASEEPDLFWAIRGAGANFGVVTRLQFRLYPLGNVLAGDILLPASRDVLRSLVPVLLAAPDELTAMPSIMLAPPDPAIPDQHHGQPVVYLSVAWSGSSDGGKLALAPLRALGSPISDSVTWKPYPDLFSPVDRDEEPTFGISSRTLFLDSLDEARIDVIERRLMEAGAPDAVVQLRVLGGEMARVPADDAAFGWRDRPVLLWLSVWDPELGRAAANDAWNAAFRAELAGPGAASYVNFMGAEEADAARGAYPAPAYARLRELKRRFDPDNVFRANHNIPPA